ncbi:hypothetical protein [Frigoribacterium sp. VKM Ac-2860]|uniref:hypothetical protein n=1 Tax=unclassified Frigoribacterium TaxID=2627005 RepID=UPI00352DE840
MPLVPIAPTDADADADADARADLRAFLAAADLTLGGLDSPHRASGSGSTVTPSARSSAAPATS